MKKPLYIYGAGGLGREILSLVLSLDQWDARGFIDDGITPGKIVSGVPVIGGFDSVNDLDSGTNVVVAIGDPLLKEKIVERFSNRIFFPVLIHPRAVLQDLSSIKVGRGSILCAGSICTCDILIGDHVLINLNATIGHDSKIGSYSSVMPGVNISGGVTIGTASLLGSGSNIRNGTIIGSRSRVGMGAVVLHDVADGDTVAGVPAKSIVASAHRS